jgi:hypothetical protein
VEAGDDERDACEPHKSKPPPSILVGLRAATLVGDADRGGSSVWAWLGCLIGGELEVAARAGGRWRAPIAAGGRRRKWEAVVAADPSRTGGRRGSGGADPSAMDGTGASQAASAAGDGQDGFSFFSATSSPNKHLLGGLVFWVG